MKLKITVLIILCILLTAAGCTTSPGVQPDPADTFIEESLPPVPDASVEPEPDADPTPDPEMAGSISAMEKVFDALSFAMHEGSYEYDPASPELFWDTIYFMTSTILTEDQEIIDDEEYMVFPENEIRQMAVTCFAGLTDMPALPKNYKKIIFNSDNLVYYAAMADYPINYTQARPDTFLSNGEEYSVVVDLYDGLEDNIVASYEFSLKANPDKSEDNAFFYRITGVKKLDQ